MRRRLGLLLALGTGISASCATAPPPVVKPVALPPGIRYLIGGDSRDDSAHVLPWAFQEAKARGVVAFLFLGDMELSPALDAHFEDELALLDPIPFYPTLGNHEVLLLGALQVGKDHAERSFRERFLGTKRTPIVSALPGLMVVYSVDLPGGLHFIALDNVSQKGFGAEQISWLSADLEQARANPATRFILVGMHKPLAGNGISKHGMDGDGPQALSDSEAVLALCVKHQVTMIFASHAHQYAEFVQRGIPSYITGGLGAPLDRAGPEHAFHHVIQLEVTDAGLIPTVIKFEGASSVAGDEAKE